MHFQQNVAFDVNVNAKSESSRRNFSRSKSEIDLEEKMERRTKEVEELIGLGQAILEEEQCDIECLDDDPSLSPAQRLEDEEDEASLSPAKRRRQASHSWQLLFEYADEVSTQLQHIDREYRLKLDDGVNLANTRFVKNASQRSYDVPEELLFVAEAATQCRASQKLSLARTKQKLSKAIKFQKGKMERRLPEQKSTTDMLIQSNPSRQFWPEVSQLKKDMNALREKLREAKIERTRTSTKIQELHGDLVKLEVIG